MAQPLRGRWRPLGCCGALLGRATSCRSPLRCRLERSGFIFRSLACRTSTGVDRRRSPPCRRRMIDDDDRRRRTMTTNDDHARVPALIIIVRVVLSLPLAPFPASQLTNAVRNCTQHCRHYGEALRLHLPSLVRTLFCSSPAVGISRGRSLVAVSLNSP